MILNRIRQYFGSDSTVPEEQRRYYYVCAICDGVSVNALWHVEQFDNELKYQCPRCGQWNGFDEHAENRLDRRMGPNGPK